MISHFSVYQLVSTNIQRNDSTVADVTILSLFPKNFIRLKVIREISQPAEEPCGPRVNSETCFMRTWVIIFFLCFDFSQSEPLSNISESLSRNAESKRVWTNPSLWNTKMDISGTSVQHFCSSVMSKLPHVKSRSCKKTKSKRRKDSWGHSGYMNTFLLQ